VPGLRRLPLARQWQQEVSIMKRSLPLLVGTGLLTLAAAAQAAQFTAHECNSYPFVHTNAPVTQRQLNRQLRELQAVGWPTLSQTGYPVPQQEAEYRLKIKYQHDCVATGLAHQDMSSSL
jgi:hypothetical protein